jgi:hypothetical protein
VHVGDGPSFDLRKILDAAHLPPQASAVLPTLYSHILAQSSVKQISLMKQSNSSWKKPPTTSLTHAVDAVAKSKFFMYAAKSCVVLHTPHGALVKILSDKDSSFQP